MADFHQTGLVTTLHRLGKLDLERIERELIECSKDRPIALILPALYGELTGPALPKIVQELKSVPYLKHIVVSLGQADRDQFDHACRFFSQLPQKTTVLWNDGPRITGLRKTLECQGLHLGTAGKGQSVWMAYGYVLAERWAKVIVVHDCDILTYSRELLARLAYPVANPHLGFDFCKGYYARYADRMYGRVTRLLLTPLLRTLKVSLQPHPLLDYLDSFRYALAGECALNVDLARVNRVPCDWGLEMGMLAEVYRNTSLKRICQAELSERYDHKHQTLDPSCPGEGLFKMSVDIAKHVFRTLAAEGVLISAEQINSALVRYQRLSEESIERYHADAAMNGLPFDRHSEESLVESFGRGIRAAGQRFLEDPLGGIPLIPNWNRVNAAVPEFLNELRAAVSRDGAGAQLVPVA